MPNFPDGSMISNRGLEVGTIITEVRLHPFLNQNHEWDFKKSTVCFEAIAVFKVEYKCRYIEAEDERKFYWPFWDKQPNHFWIDGCSPVQYYTHHKLDK